MQYLHNDSLEEFIQKIDVDFSSINSLALVHTTNISRFLGIINEMSLIPRQCHHFNNEELLYLFYGRGAYIPKNTERKTIPYYLLPINIIINSKNIMIYKSYGFDSGGFFNGMYNSFIDKKELIESFSLTPSVDFYRKYIYYFYGTNNNYLNDLVKNDLKLFSYCKVNQYYELIKSSTIEKRDRTIEVIVNEKIDLASNCIAIVIPDILQTTAPEVVDIIKSKNIKICIYNLFGHISLETASDRLHYETTKLIQKLGGEED